MEALKSPGGGLTSWQSLQGSMAKTQWQRRVAEMAKSYVHFMRDGVKCGCGCTLRQPAAQDAVDTGGSAKSASASSAPAEEIINLLSDDEDDAPVKGATSSKSGGSGDKGDDGAVVILDDDDDDDNGGPAPSSRNKSYVGPPSGFNEVRAPPLDCERCARSYCAACGEEVAGSQPARNGTGVAIAVDLIDDDGDGGAAPPPAKQRRTGLGKGESAASSTGDAPALPDARDHARTCSLRYVHGIASAVERIRRIHLGIDAGVLGAEKELLAAISERAGKEALSGGGASHASSVATASYMSMWGIPYPSAASSAAAAAAGRGAASSSSSSRDPVEGLVAAVAGLVRQGYGGISVNQYIAAAGLGPSAAAAAGARGAPGLTGWQATAPSWTRGYEHYDAFERESDAHEAMLDEYGPDDDDQYDELGDYLGDGEEEGELQTALHAWRTRRASRALYIAQQASASSSAPSSSSGAKAAAAAPAAPGPSADAKKKMEEEYASKVGALMASIVEGKLAAAGPGGSYGGGHAASSGAASGTGYAGGTDDATRVRVAEALKKVRSDVRDKAMAPALRALNAALPRDIYDSSGYYSEDTVRGGKLVAGLVTDGASDHPLLLQLLLGPGFADGLPAGPAQVAPASAADSAGIPPSTPAPASGRGGRGRGRGRGGAAAAPAPSAGSKRDRAAATSSPSALPSGAALTKQGAGDGLVGPSVWYHVYSDCLRTSILDAGTQSEAHRTLFFGLLGTLEALGRHPDLAAALLYTVPEAPPAPPAAASGAAAPLPYVPWSVPSTIFGARAGAGGGLLVIPPEASLCGLLSALKKQAAIYNKNSSVGDNEVISGDAADDAEYTGVLCLARDVETTAERVEGGVRAWSARQQVLAAAQDVNIDDEEEEDDGEEAEEVVLVGATAGAAAAAPAAKGRGRGRGKKAAPAPAPTGASAAPSAAALRSAVNGVIDPAAHGTAGTGRLPAAFKPDPATVRTYEHVLRDEAFTTMDGLVKEHAIVKEQGGSGASASSGGASMKRLVRVSAEMSNLPSLAVHWASSILARQDGTSMDVMRAAMTGPADTPYANGFFLFDILLPAEYPAVPPKAKFLTTGGGLVRFNPNLYAEGKVCLSLLGTWSGPGWVPGTSTLSQVLLSIQGQILVDAPYANEPGYERHLGTDMGKRAVAKHNALLRLGTIRHAMVEQAKRPPRGFERASAAHFYYKRAELAVQMGVWCGEAADMAAYEMELMRASFTAKLRYEAAAKADGVLTAAAVAAAAAAAPKGPHGSHHPSYASYPTGYGGGAIAKPPTDYPFPTGTGAGAGKLSASTQALYYAYSEANAALTRWQSDTAVSGHNPFARGIGPTPRNPAPNAVGGQTDFTAAAESYLSGNGGGSSSASSSSSSALSASQAMLRAMYARLGRLHAELAVPGGPMVAPASGSAAAYAGFSTRMGDLAFCTAAAADELLAELAKLQPPPAEEEEEE